MSGRRAAWIARTVVVVVTLALAHDLTFLARYGSIYGEALAHAGHGPAWTTAVVVCLTLGAGLAVAAALQLWRLRATVGTAERGRDHGLAANEVRQFGRSWAALSARLGAVVAVLLTVQENVERAAIGVRAADPAILVSAQYSGALGILVAVAIGVSFVVTLFRWRRDALLARMRGTIGPGLRPLSVRLPRRRPATPRGSVLGRGLGLRAPPPGVAIGIAA